MNRTGGSWIAGFVCIGGLLVGGETVRAFQKPLRERLPNFDKRHSPAAPTKAVTSAKVAAAVRVRGARADVRIDFDAISGSPKWIASPGGFLTGTNGNGLSAAARAAVTPQDPYHVTKAFIQDNRDLFGHGPAALEAARIKREYVAAHNGLHTVVWEQRLDNIAVFDSVLISHTTRNDELVSVSSTFLPDLATAGGSVTAARAAPAIPARRAVALAAANLADSVKEAAVTEKTAATGAEQRQQLQAPGLDGDVDAGLIWLPMNAGAVRLCWDVVLTSHARGEMFRVLVDVQSGEVLLRRCLTDYISDASYRVYASDSPSPFSPGHATPLTTQPPVVPRVLVVTNAFDTNASPNGWINDGVNETRGNNVDAHTDRNGTDQPDLPRPQGSPFRVFDFPLDLTQAPNAYSNAAVVQLFFLCNWYHDRLYELGFTEAAGNFQNNNFGRGGLGNDAVQADGQDGSSLSPPNANNANFSTPPDGSPGRMQMYIFNGPTPGRDGDLDAEIVFHEFTHGLSSRRVGGGGGISALQSAGLGEGWSDFCSLALLSEAGDNLDGNYAAGGYATYQLGGLTQNYYYGIRRYPYSTDLTKNPLTFKDIDPGQAVAHPGVPLSPLNSPFDASIADEVHSQGEVWCVTLWEARARLINKYGWAAGNQLILQLVADGMNLSPVNPNFVQARDALLQADLVDNGGANLIELWMAFARRGLGFSATSPASSMTAGVRESFDLPDDLRLTPIEGFVGRGPVGGPFIPNAMTLSLTNAGSNSLNWTLVNTSSWLNVSLAGGTLTPGGAASVTARLDNSASTLPMGIYTAVIRFTNLTSAAAQSRAFSLLVGQPDYFTELFDAEDNDLDFSTFTFTPNGSVSHYSVCREAATNLPTPPAGGTTILLSDDSSVNVTLTGTNTVAIYNRRTNVFFIGSNGYLTLDSGDSNFGESFVNHFNRPRVSALFDDLDAGSGGTISWKQTSELVAVTFEDVREFGSDATVSFQIEMFFDGRIRLTYLAVGITDGLAGLSAGAGVPAGFTESSFKSYGPCLPSLFVTVPGTATEGDGLLAGAGHVYLAAPLTTNLPVALNSMIPTEVSGSNTVVLAGQTNAAFDLFVLDDGLLDGSQSATLTASAPGHANGTATITVFDNEATRLHVSLPATTTEGDGEVQGMVWADRAPAANVSVSLTSSDTTEIQVPASVFIPAGQTSTVFTATVMEDTQIDGPQTATVTARVQNWTDGSASIAVLDNEPLTLTVTLPASAYESVGVLANAGRVSLAGTLATNLVVTLQSSDLTGLTVPGSVTIAAGQFFAIFNLTFVDDPQVDGAQNVTVTAAALGFANGAAKMSVLDDETPPVPLNPNPPHLATNVPARLTLSWQSGAETELIVNGGFESNSFAGWVRVPNGNGDFQINDGVFDWPSPDPPLAPFEGRFSALATQTGPGAHWLYQEVRIPPGVTGAVLRWVQRVRNFYSDFSADQQFRVELRNTNDVVLAVPFVTSPDDPLLGDWVNRSFDLTPFAGQTVRLTFWVNPGSFYLDVYLDNVSVTVPNLGAPITNDVYFSTNPAPGPGQLLGSTINTRWTLPQLAPLTTYFWQVVVRRAGTTPGPVWQFTTKGVDHFDWSAIASPQLLGEAFATTITARDEFGSVVSNFTGAVSLAGQAGSNTVAVFHDDFEDGDFAGWDDDGGDYVRAVTNDTAAGGVHSFTLIGGNQTHSDGISHSLMDLTPDRAEFHVRAKAADLAGGYVVLGQSQIDIAAFFYMREDGQMGIFDDVGGWHATPYLAGVWYKVILQFDWTHRSVDYFVDDALIETNIPFRTQTVEHLATVNLYNFHNTQNWWDEIQFFQDGRSSPIAIMPTNSSKFVNGAWTGNLTVLQPATNMYLLASDARGQRGTSNPFDVRVENDLVVNIADRPDPVALGDRLTNVITVANSGPAAATSVTVTNLLPAGATFVSATATQGSSVYTAGVLRCDLGTLPGRASATVTVVSQPTSSGLITNRAYVGRAEPDGYAGNNTAVSVTSVLTPTLSITDAVVQEGNAGVTKALFRVSLLPPTLRSVLVAFATSGGTAVAGNDYTPTNGVLIFSPGQSRQFIQVAVRGDANAETDETFLVTLAGPINASLGKAVGTGTILNDDLMTLGEAVDAAGLVWAAGGNVPWIGQTLTAHDGQDAAQSGSISDLEESWMQTTVVGPGSLSFWWKVSSENTFDYLEFYNDNVVQGGRISGEVDWQLRTFAITAGTHTLRWRYFKDASVSSGEDHGWVDQVIYSSIPRITRQPAGQLADTGGTAAFTVAAFGDLPLTYQWRFNGAAISNANTTALTLTGLTTNHAGSYSVSVSNFAGVTVSTDAILSVADAGSIFFDDFEPDVDTRQWTGFGGAVGSTVLATNYGGSVSPVNSLWFDLTGSRFATTRALNTTNGGVIRFFLRLADGFFAPWEMPDLPDQGVVLEYSTNLTLNFGILGRYDTPDFYNWKMVSLPIPTAARLPSVYFRWRQLTNSVAGFDNWALDDTLIAQELPLPAVTLQPADQRVSVGGTAMFNVEASGLPPLLYQWDRNGMDIPGATGLTLTITNVQSADAGSYAVRVSNLAGSVTSSNAMLQVNHAPIAYSQTVAVDEELPVGITLLAADLEGDPLAYTFVILPAHGALTGAAPNVTYQSAPNYNGPDSFVFRVSDGTFDSALATVSITVVPVNDPPIAIARAFPRVLISPWDTNGVIISPNNLNAFVFLDGSQSFDVELAPLTYSWFEVGITNSLGSGVVVSKVMPVGEHLIELVVSDGAATGTNRIVVTVISAAEAAQQLIALVKTLDLSPRHRLPLLATLSVARAALARGRFEAASKLMKAFQNQVRAQVEPVKPGEAAAWLRTAQVIIDALSASDDGAPADCPAARGRIESVTRQANGHVWVTFAGLPGHAHLIQTSTNLVDWETIGVGTEVSERLFEFEDSNAAHYATRFYRTLQSP